MNLGKKTIGALVMAIAVATPAAAIDKEQRQLMADVRILQEQNQQLQNMLGSIAEAIKAVNARIDEQAKITDKAAADQKLVIDNLSNNVREIREKLDDNNVRLGSLNQEVEALRQGLQQLNAPPALTSDAGTTPAAPGVGDTGPGPAAGPTPAVALGTSPQKLYDEAWADYTLGQWDLAISGFDAVIKYFPKSERAADAQVQIGHSYLAAGKNDKAVEAYDLAIRNYPGAPALPDAFYKKGVALKNMKQIENARAAFDYVVKNYPESAAASLARQQITQPKP